MARYAWILKHEDGRYLQCHFGKESFIYTRTQSGAMRFATKAAATRVVAIREASIWKDCGRLRVVRLKLKEKT
jgi:hypothetical protein